MLRIISIYVGGLLTLLLAVFHTRFYKFFSWGKDYSNLAFINQKIFYTIHVALYLLFFAFVFISFAYAEELAASQGLAFAINSCLALFWLWRMVWQVYYFRFKIPGKRTGVSYLKHIMTLWFFALFVAYAVPPLVRLAGW